MSAWSEDKEEPESWDWDAVKQGVLVGIGCVVAVIAWMAFARPGEEAPLVEGLQYGIGGRGSERRLGPSVRIAVRRASTWSVPR